MSTTALLGSAAFGTVAALSSLSDLRHRRIPDELVGSGLIAVVLLAPSLATVFASGAVGYCTFFLVRLLSRGRMGLGDVKLSGYFAAALGARLWWLTVVVACAAALLVLAARPRPYARARDQSLPFAPFLSFGALSVLLVANLSPSLAVEALP